jgi:CheY-like chemotaxis protein
MEILDNNGNDGKRDGQVPVIILQAYARQAEDALRNAKREIDQYLAHPDRSKLQHIKLVLQDAAEMIQKWQDKQGPVEWEVEDD